MGRRPILATSNPQKHEQNRGVNPIKSIRVATLIQNGLELEPLRGQSTKMLHMSLLGASWGHLVAKA